MLLWMCLGFLYLAIALFAIAQTHAEHRQHHHTLSLTYVASFVLCMIWPVMIAVVYVTMKAQPLPMARRDSELIY